MVAAFKYFVSVTGRAVQRYGTASFIGCARAPGGFAWTPDPVAIPIDEYSQHARDYLYALRQKDLIGITEAQALELQVQLDNERAQEQAKIDEQEAAAERAQTSTTVDVTVVAPSDAEPESTP